MSTYAIAVYLHIVGALGLFAAIGVEWAGLGGLRRASTSAQVGEWTRLLRTVHRLERLAALLILISGVYLAMRWGHQAWIGLGLIGLVFIGALGGALGGRRVAAIARALPNDDDGIPHSVRRLLDDPILRLSAWLRTAVGLGVVFLMSVKPGSGATLSVIGASLALGLILGLPGLRSAQSRSPAAAASQPIGS